MNGLFTIEDYLRSISPLIGDEALRYVLLRRKINEGTPLSDLDDKTVDLAAGTAYFWLCTLPDSQGTVKDEDGDWSHSEGGWTISKETRADWKRLAKALFAKWGEEPPVVSGVRLINLC